MKKFAGDPAGRNAFLFPLLRLRLIALYFLVSPLSCDLGSICLLGKDEVTMFHRWLGALLALVALPYVNGQPPGVINPLAQDCGSGGSVVCINKYVRSYA